MPIGRPIQLLTATLVLGHVLVCGAQSVPQLPFSQHPPYAAGTIRPSHRSQSQLDDDVRAYYDQWKPQFLVAAGTSPTGAPLYRVSFGSANPGETVSEGQGYGMIIAAIMAGYDPEAQALFDGLWLFARQHPSTIDPSLMDFSVPGSEDGDDSAFDGDADMAYALLLAERQWGNGGAINYRAEFDRTIAAIVASTIGVNSHLPLLGDWIDPADKKTNEFTPRSSDFMIGHFRAFQRATGNAVWGQVVTASQDVISSLQASRGRKTGLLPDFITRKKNGTFRPVMGKLIETRLDGLYGYNACRDPWRLGTDAVLNGDPVSLAQTQKMSAWVAGATGGNPQAIRAGYKLNGKPAPNSKYFTIVFAAPFGVAAMTNPAQQEWLNAVYDAVATTHEDYYEDTVTLLSLLVMSGTFWDPTTIAP